MLGGDDLIFEMLCVWSWVICVWLRWMCLSRTHRFARRACFIIILGIPQCITAPSLHQPAVYDSEHVATFIRNAGEVR